MTENRHLGRIGAVLISAVLVASGCSTTPSSSPSASTPAASTNPSTGPGPSQDLAGWAAEPMKETTKVVLAIEDGPLPTALSRYQDEIKRKLNIELEIARHPFTEQYPIEYLDLTSSGRFDLLSFWPTYMGDFGPYLTKLADVAPGGEEQAYTDMQMDGVVEGYRWVAYHGTDLKALQYDGDVKVLYYRKDKLTDPAEQAAYRAQFGKDLACPDTYEDYLQQAKFFTRPADDFYGAAQIAGFLSYFTFVDHYMGMGGHFFDPADMKPFPDRALALKAIENMVDVFASGSAPEARSFEFGDARNQILTQDRAVFVPMWPDIWKWGGDPNLSNSNGNIWACTMPGGRPDMAGGRIIGISEKSQVKEAAYKVLAFFADGDRTAQLVNDNTSWMDPWRISHMNPNLYASMCSTDVARCENFVETIQETINIGYPVLNIPGSGRYHEAIERLATGAITGQNTPQATLDQLVAELEAITDAIGRDQQQAAYQQYVDEVLKPKGLYP